MEKNPEMVNDKMAEGFTALHLAAVNNCLETANVLVKSVSKVLTFCVKNLPTIALLQTWGKTIFLSN